MIMKRTKLLSILSLTVLLVMGTFMFVSCGDDDPVVITGPNSGTKVAPTQSQLLGTWRITTSPLSAGMGGPTVGTEVYFASDGNIKMKYEGNVLPGTYTYNTTTGHLLMYMPQEVGNIDVTLSYVNGFISMSFTQNGVPMTAVLTKVSENDAIEEESQTQIETGPMFGQWIITNCDNARYINSPAVFDNNNVTIFGFNTDYRWERDNSGRILLFIGENSGEGVLQGKFVSVQNGNVVTGQFIDGSNKMGTTFTRNGFTVPNSGIMGRWQVTNITFDGPSVGDVIVFGANGEMYLEGDPHIYGYSMLQSVLNIILEEDGTMSGVLTTSGWTTGSTASWVMTQNSGMRLDLVKL